MFALATALHARSVPSRARACPSCTELAHVHTTRHARDGELRTCEHAGEVEDPHAGQGARVPSRGTVLPTSPRRTKRNSQPGLQSSRGSHSGQLLNQ